MSESKLAFILKLSVAACSCSASTMCCLDEFSRSKREAGLNPWNRKIAPCACTAWCCGWLYAVFVLIFGGLMVVLNVIGSSMCLPMEDVSSQLLQDIMPALGLKADNPDEFDMVKDMLDGCFSQKVSSAEASSLMDIMFTRENGSRVTLRQKIHSQTTNMMSSRFANLDEKLAAGEKMMEHPRMSELLSLLNNNPVDALILGPSLDKLPSSGYKALVLDPRRPRTATSVEVGVMSSLACDDFTFQGRVIKGLRSLKTNMIPFAASGAAFL